MSKHGGSRSKLARTSATVDLQELDYLVGGLRITLDQNSRTPGPRSHILNFTSALRALGIKTRIFLASELPILKELSRAPEGGGVAPGAGKILVADFVRIFAAILSGLGVRIQMHGSSAGIIYERVAVMQSLSSFHPRRRSATRIVESNGLMSIETAEDRQALVLRSLARIIERHVYKRADLVVTVSQALAERVQAFAGIPESRILIVPNAIPDDICEPVSLSRPSQFIVGFTGAVVPWQRLERLIQGVALAVNNGLRLRVQVIGEGSEKSRLEEEVRRLELLDVFEFTGRLNREDTLKMMSTWAVGYAGHTARTNSQMYHSPLKIYEYAGLGLGVVATDYPDAHQLVADGMRIEFASTAQEVAQALVRLRRDYDLGELPDRVLAESLVAKHSWEGRVRYVLNRVSQQVEGYGKE